jgi:hypothetical protein
MACFVSEGAAAAAKGNIMVANDHCSLVLMETRVSMLGPLLGRLTNESVNKGWQKTAAKKALRSLLDEAISQADRSGQKKKGSQHQPESSAAQSDNIKFTKILSTLLHPPLLSLSWVLNFFKAWTRGG